MKLRQVVGIGLVSFLALVVCAVSVPQDVPAMDGEIAEASRKPGGINPADIDWRCSIMAGRMDRAFIPCYLFAEQESGRTAAVQFLIDNNLIDGHRPAGPGPLRQYTEEEARALGLIPPAFGSSYQR
jgi:hypothetical protein